MEKVAKVQLHSAIVISKSARERCSFLTFGNNIAMQASYMLP